MKLLFLDTETTDLKPGQIAQLSYIINDGISLLHKNFFFSVENMSFGAQNVHGFSKDILSKLSNGQTFKDVYKELISDI